MPFPMQPAQFPAGGWPEGTDRPSAAAQTFPYGTPLRAVAATGAVEEHPLAATVTNVLGISLEGATDGAEDNPSGTVNYAKANRTNVFAAKAVSDAGAIQATPATLIGTVRGLQKVGANRAAWFGVRTTDDANPIVIIVGVDTERDIVFFKFLESAIQEP